MYKFEIIVKADSPDIEESFVMIMSANSISDVLVEAEEVYKRYTDHDVNFLLEKIVAIEKL